MANLSPADFDQWVRQDVTKAFVKQLQESVDEAKDAWAQGAFTSETEEAATRLNQVALAEVRTLQKVMESIESYKLLRAAER